MQDIIGFLTRIPVRTATRLEEVAARAYLFPIAALFIGLLIATTASVTFRFLASTPEIAALLTLLAIYLVTGLIHLDGLADFFDGMMAGGGRIEKLKAMKDVKIGIAGLFAVVFLLLLCLFAIDTVCITGGTGTFHKFTAVFVIAEVSAKLSMNTCILLGRRFNTGSGMGALFIRATTMPKYIVAFISAVLISLIVTSFSVRFFIMFSGIAVAFVIAYVAKRNFGMVTGDVIGASNELARCVALLIWATSSV
ncbi:MAG: adenosylcobinamide-GDP ribazoletransferase [Halobacteriota archaeon]